MFRLIPNPTFVAAVPLSVPGEGTAMPISFTFRHRSKTALAAFVKLAAEKPLSELLPEIIEDWSGVEGPDGKPVPYTTEALAALLDNYTTAGQEILSGYLRELTESRAKN